MEHFWKLHLELLCRSGNTALAGSAGLYQLCWATAPTLQIEMPAATLEQSNSRGLTFFKLLCIISNLPGSLMFSQVLNKVFLCPCFHKAPLQRKLKLPVLSRWPEVLALVHPSVIADASRTCLFVLNITQIPHPASSMVTNLKMVSCLVISISRHL